MSDWRIPLRFLEDDEGLQHPNARAGGLGPAAAPLRAGPAEPSHSVPHPSAPAAKAFDWISLPEFDVDDRALAVLEAVKIAGGLAPGAVLHATGEHLEAILDGIIPGLLMCLCVVAATTGIGGLAGAAIGALAGGVGAAPGAVAGAGAGLDAGILLLDALGLGFLVVAIGASLIEATRLSVEAVREAWTSIDDPRSRRFHIEHAAQTLAAALGVLMRGILEGLVAFLTAQGAAAAASRVPGLVAKLRRSRLGEAFAVWIESNWQRLLANERFKPKPPASGGTGGDPTPAAPAPGPPKPSPGEKPPAPKPKEEAPAKPKEETAPKEKPKAKDSPDADPARKVFGPAHESHPNEIAQMRRELEAAGVDIKERPNDMGYGPGLRPGEPGQLIIDPDASYSAWLHEYQHAMDDKADGWKGMGQLFDNDLRWQREQAAYGREIEFAEANGQPKLADDLRNLMELERQRIYGENQ